jgi:hypothetical protein
MKTILVIATLVLLLSAPAFTQDKPAREEAEKQKPAATPEQLEATFKAMLTGATMTGRWCSIKDGKLGAEKEDRYSIVGANKVSGHKWVISARIKVHQREMVVPIPVEVKWAGDTAVLSVDKLQYPGGGTYSARVLFYEHTYAGTWSGGDYGGLMNGVIKSEAAEKSSAPRN